MWNEEHKIQIAIQLGTENLNYQRMENLNKKLPSRNKEHKSEIPNHGIHDLLLGKLAPQSTPKRLGV